MTDLFFNEIPFSPSGKSHLLAVLVFFGVAALLIGLGRRYRGGAKVRLIEKVCGAAVILSFVLAQFYYLSPERINLRKSLPLDLCDLAWWMGGIALLTRWRFAQSALYFWGLTLSVQGLITPVSLEWDFPHVRFLLFWFAHMAIVWVAAYLTWGLGIRPAWSDYRKVVSVSLVWMGVVFVANRVLGSNYMMLNHKPAPGTVLDYLGPWPQYLMVEIAIILGVWAMMTITWTKILPKTWLLFLMNALNKTPS